MPNEVQTSPFHQMQAALNGRQERIEQLLPPFMKGQSERLVARALQYWARGDWKLQQCTVASFVSCVLNAAELGFAIDGRLCYAVPFNTKVKKASKNEPDRWEHKAQLIPSYIGLLAVAKRTGLIQDAWSRVVLKKDAIEFSETDGAVSYEYVPDLDAPRDRAEDCRGILSVAVHSAGWRRADWMPWADVLAIKNRPKPKDDGPWITDPGEMSKKTGLKRLLKTFSDDPGLLRILELDDQAEARDPEEITEEKTAARRSIVIPAIADHTSDIDPGGPPPWENEVVPEPAEAAPELPREVSEQVFHAPPPKEPEQPADAARPTAAQIVDQYKKAITVCDSEKSAKALLKRAQDDPFLRSPPLDAAVIKYVGELLQGCVTQWKQTKQQKGLIP